MVVAKYGKSALVRHAVTHAVTLAFTGRLLRPFSATALLGILAHIVSLAFVWQAIAALLGHMPPATAFELAARTFRVVQWGMLSEEHFHTAEDTGVRHDRHLPYLTL